MTRRGFRTLLAVLCSVAALCAGVFALQARETPTARVSFLEGSAEVQRSVAGLWSPLALGALLDAGCAVRTGAGAKLELTLPDGSLLRVAAGSVVQLASLLTSETGAPKELRFKVTAGKLWATVSKALDGGRTFEVQTGNAVAGVRGTVFRVDVAEDAATIVKVYSGAVAVNNTPVYARQPEPGGGRVEVPGPQQVTKKQWEELVAKAMQEVRVAADGAMKMADFTAESEKEDAWTQWNQERDRAAAVKE